MRKRSKRFLAAILAGMLVCSGGSRYSSVMAFSMETRESAQLEENAEGGEETAEEAKNAEMSESPEEETVSEETVSEETPSEEAPSEEAPLEEPEETPSEEPSDEEKTTEAEESSEDETPKTDTADEQESESTEEETEPAEEKTENAQNAAAVSETEKKCIASFSFDKSEDGLQGAGAKAEVLDSSKSVILSNNGYHGRALYLDGTGDSVLRVTKENGSSLLTGLKELTVSYYGRTTRPETSEETDWGFYAAPDDRQQTFQNEKYLGVFKRKEVIGAERYNSNNTARPEQAVCKPVSEGWHHITAVFSDAENQEEETKNPYKITLYVDGEKKSEVENPYSLEDLLKEKSILWIGKANWEAGQYYQGYIDEYRIYNYAMTEDEVRNLTVQPSEEEEFSKVLYFDNALSRLEGVEPDTSDNVEANGAEESGLYYSYDEGKTWYSMSRMDAEEGLGKQVSYVSLWKATVPETAAAIQFRGWYRGYKRFITYATGYRTSAVQAIPTETDQNCYYGNPMVHQLDTTGTVLNGHWANVNEINTIGQQSVEIPAGTFTRDKNVYYGNSSFFDYYSDYELNGKKLSESNKTNEDEYNDQPLYAWNLALDRYYKEEQDVKPLYFGGARMMINNGDLNQRLTGYDGRIAGGNGYSGADNKKLTGQKNAFFPNKGLLSTTTLDGSGLKLKNSSLTVPYFDADYLKGDNEEKTQFASVYQNIAFPFTISDSGYWTFDSSDAAYALQMKKDSSSGNYFLEQTKKPVQYGNNNYFFPFNAAGSHDYAQAQNLDYMFGSVIEVPFALTENRKTEEKNTVFTFSGDDDVWVFLEGPDGAQHLVLDIGGSHGAVSGAIDFTTGLVATSGNWSALGDNAGTATAMGKDDFIQMAEEDGVQSIINKYSDYIWSDSLENMGIDVSKYQSYKEYKIKVYYMERGLDQSNLRITFNFVNNKNVEVKKEWSDGADTHTKDSVSMTLYQVSSKTGRAKVTDPADIGVQYEGDSLVDPESGSVNLSSANKWSCRWGKLNTKSNEMNSDETYSYYVAESGSPAAYVVQYYNNTDGTRLKEQELTLEDGKKVMAVPANDISVSIRVENKKVGRLQIKKESADLSGTKTALSDITFELYQSNDKWKKVGTVLAAKTTDKDGLVTFEDLFPGNYLLYETVGKDGYDKPEEPWKITVAGDGTVTVLGKGNQNLAVLNTQDENDGSTNNQATIVNYKLLNLELLKVDAENSSQPLEGVEFKLERQLETGKWKSIATAVTNADGYISGNNFDGLQEGNYRLTETKAATGYNLLEEQIFFSIGYVAGADNKEKVEIKLADGTPENIQLEKQEDNFTVKLTVPNTRGVVMPATGGNGTGNFLLGGSLFLMAGLLYGYYLRRRRERRRMQ